MCLQIKKVIRILLIISLCLLLCSCYDGDLYKGRRPIDYPDSYWVCEEHDMYFVVGENQELIDAKITAYGQTVPFRFIWSRISNEVSINFTVDSQLYGMSGPCKFGRKKFSIQIEYKENLEGSQLVEYKENPEGEAPLMVFERRTIEEYISEYGKKVDGSSEGIDPYKGKRPIDYPDSYWVCEEAQMYFLVGENQELIDAKVTAYGQTVPCEFAWSIIDNSINITFRVDSQTYVMYGSCNFGENKFTIRINRSDSSKEEQVIEFERRTLEEYLADHG